MKKKLIRILVALCSFLIVFTIDKVVDLDSYFTGVTGFILPFILYLIIYLLVGYDVVWKAFRNVSRGQFLDENFLMVLATFGAFGLAIYRGINGQSLEGFDEACAVLLFYQIGEWLQKYASGKSRDSIAHLMDLRPDYANLLTNHEIIKVDPSEVKIGSCIVVHPGEKIPLDGIVMNGVTDLDVKSLTGESLPLNVKINDEVLSGCVNLTSQITVRVTKTYYESTSAKILDLVENAAMKKSKAENFITKFARYYTPLVIFSAVLLVIIAGLVTNDWGMSLYRALSFLVVSCPCALVISVPLTFFISLGVASKNGVLIKGSNYLEKLNQAKIFVFDKTGTLTKGNFVVTAVEPSSKRAEILRLAAIAEKNSSHPIARAIMAAYGQSISFDYTLTNVAGQGVIATNGTETIYCGSAQLLQNKKINFISQKVSGTVVYVAHNQKYVGCLIIQDEIKPETADVLNGLSNVSSQTIMLTGDNESVASNIAANLGLSAYRANLLPQDKVSVVEDLLLKKNPKEALCFIGDGINDAPSLIRADVGITMGGLGSDAALEASDIVLMRDDLHGILTAKHLAHRTMRIVRQNIIFSILIKLGILTLSAFGLANMWLAIFGDVGVALLTILNAFRVKHRLK
ncbi:MAG: cadmium-translocating P-type ATPase [Clostridia bacterium]|nr:cadmium-translocating P-type ATPase [Clostridia bacterium]